MRSTPTPTPAPADGGVAPVIRRIRPDEADRYRDIRLRALTDSPFAFGTTAADAAARPLSWWTARTLEQASSDRSALFIAERGDDWLGLAGGEVVEGSATVEVISMWVALEARRHGVALALLDTIERWARGRDAAHLQLWVTEGNTPAIAAYERFGFVLTGDRQRVLPEDPARHELLMRMQCVSEGGATFR